jgi:hypothetical protein
MSPIGYYLLHLSYDTRHVSCLFYFLLLKHRQTILKQKLRLVTIFSDLVKPLFFIFLCIRQVHTS